MLCSQCGANSQGSQLYCMVCGASLKNDSVTTPKVAARKPIAVNRWKIFYILSAVFFTLISCALLNLTSGNSMLPLFTFNGMFWLWTAIYWLRKVDQFESGNTRNLWIFRISLVIVSFFSWPLLLLIALLYCKDNNGSASLRVAAIGGAVFFIVPLLIRFTALTASDFQEQALRRRHESEVASLVQTWGNVVNVCEPSYRVSGGTPSGLTPVGRLLLLDWTYPNARVDEFQSKIPSEEQAKSGQDVEYIVCLVRYENTSQCSYKASGSLGDGSPRIKPVQYGIRGSIISVGGDVALAQFDILGSPPDPCPESILEKNGAIISVTTRDGKEIPFSEFHESGGKVTFEEVYSKIHTTINGADD